jgi:hypothetical protein
MTHSWLPQSTRQSCCRLHPWAGGHSGACRAVHPPAARGWRRRATPCGGALLPARPLDRWCLRPAAPQPPCLCHAGPCWALWPETSVVVSGRDPAEAAGRARLTGHARFSGAGEVTAGPECAGAATGRMHQRSMGGACCVACKGGGGQRGLSRRPAIRREAHLPAAIWAPCWQRWGMMGCRVRSLGCRRFSGARMASEGWQPPAAAPGAGQTMNATSRTFCGVSGGCWHQRQRSLDRQLPTGLTPSATPHTGQEAWVAPRTALARAALGGGCRFASMEGACRERGGGGAQGCRSAPLWGHPVAAPPAGCSCRPTGRTGQHLRWCLRPAVHVGRGGWHSAPVAPSELRPMLHPARAARRLLKRAKLEHQLTMCTAMPPAPGGSDLRRDTRPLLCGCRLASVALASGPKG